MKKPCDIIYDVSLADPFVQQNEYETTMSHFPSIFYQKNDLGGIGTCYHNPIKKSPCGYNSNYDQVEI